ncbi:MAG TPA: PP2C family protein-serine/threonine phosphatase [Candidatus Polarisedimenticolia bacterium]|nr:PP2C family protein-serine/threonine phosphatase [Candidatus Polarisedimenticolia bacterium]
MPQSSEIESKPGTQPDRAAGAERAALYRSFWRKLESRLTQVAMQPDLTATLDAIVQTLLREFRPELPIVAGRIYEKAGGDRYVLRRWHGNRPAPEAGYSVPVSYPVIQALLERGLVIMRETDPEFDPNIESPLGVTVFAAMTLGTDNRWLLSFSIDGEYDRERLLYLLSAVQHVVGQRIRQWRLRDVMEEARMIQQSLLPRASPSFGHYDIHGQSIPAEGVGGDLFDFIPLSDRILGIAVADASGHGLPAALQARDVITGLRMGIEENLKIVSTVEKLNKVINRSTLAARFVSLFYGELERNGNFIYCSAGHPPGLLMHRDGIKRLAQGGMVLGPDPAARYERGYVELRAGDVILLYSDGITEATDPAGDDFGLERLERILTGHPALEAKALVDLVFREVERFSRRNAPADDQTVVVVRHPGR